MPNWEADDHGERLVPLQPGTGETAQEYPVMLDNGYNASVILPFEWLDERALYHAMGSSIVQQAVSYSLVYVVVIFTARHLMERRPRYELRTALTVWNLLLAAMSIGGAIRMNQELYHVLTSHGWQHSVCVRDYGKAPFGFWLIMFILSKVVEFGDTVFIVLRKQPLIFLHWYHHIATLLYTWVSWSERTSTGRWFVTMNYTVHAFMYSYYACRAMRIRIPRWVSMAITTMQTSQMAVGLAVNAEVLRVKHRGGQCQQSYANVALALAMYFSYFLLFSWFFYNAYIRTKPKATKPTENGFHKQQNGVHSQNGKVHNGIATNGIATNGIATNGVKKFN